MKTTLTYEKFVHDNEEHLKMLHNKNVYVAYAGGKDASVILHFFTRAKEEFDFEFETHSAMFPAHVYTKDDVHKLDSYWKKRGVHVTWHPIKKNESIFETARNQGTNPCEVCHSTKRAHFLEYLESTVTDWNPVVFVLGWSLWDIVSYSLEYLLGNVFTEADSMYQGKTMQERFYRTAQRFYPILRMKEGYTLYKPLLRYNDQDIRKVIAENEIPILTTDCRYKEFRPKRYFADSYMKLDMYFDYDKVMKFAQESLHLEKPSSYEAIDKKDFILSIV